MTYDSNGKTVLTLSAVPLHRRRDDRSATAWNEETFKLYLAQMDERAEKLIRVRRLSTLPS